jgi:hypothetical protein
MRSDLVQTVMEAYRAIAEPSTRAGTADSEDRMYDRGAGVLDLAGVEKVLFKCGESMPALNFMYLAEVNSELDTPVGEDFSEARMTLGSFVRVLHASERGQWQEHRVRTTSSTSSKRRFGVDRGWFPHMDNMANPSTHENHPQAEEIDGVLNPDKDDTHKWDDARGLIKKQLNRVKADSDKSPSSPASRG